MSEPLPASAPAREPLALRRLPPAQLDDRDRATYEWQMWVRGFGEEGQRRLKSASVLVSRIGGLGGPAAFELAAAGIGRLVLAHGGDLRESDLNRQLLMRADRLGQSRVRQAAERLREFNPRLEIVEVGANASAENADRLVAMADVVVDAAPLFAERFALNAAAVRAGVPLVECAMYELEAHVTTVIPGRTPCLQCVYGEAPPTWKRQFPVIGAVPGTAGCIGALEVIKLITGIGRPLAGELLAMDLGDMSFRKRRLARDPACPVCAASWAR